MRYRIVDCSFVLDDPGLGGRELYLRAHISGAPHLQLETELMGRPTEQAPNPLPSAEQFAEVASRAGIGPGIFVIAYEQGTPAVAARLWWLLRHFGHDDCAVLHGGLEAWRGPLASGEEQAEPAVFVPRSRNDDTVDADELLARLGDPQLAILDTRSPDRFHGKPKVGLEGHIPGARNLPYLDASPLPHDVLEAREIVVYCGSGVSACIILHELALAGRPDAKLYPGSWKDWSARGLPTETG